MGYADYYRSLKKALGYLIEAEDYSLPSSKPMLREVIRTISKEYQRAGKGLKRILREEEES